MNFILNFNRFKALLYKNLGDHYPKYLLSLGANLGFMGLLFYFIPFHLEAHSEPYQNMLQHSFLTTGMILGGAILTSTIFSDYGEKNKAIATILVPASITEKFGVAWIISVVLYLLVYLPLYYFLLWVFVYFKGESGFAYLNFFSPEGLKLIWAFLLFQSIYFLGSIYFNKYQFIIISLATIILSAAITWFNKLFLEGIIGKKLFGYTPFGEIGIQNGDLVEITRLNPNPTVRTLIVILLALVFWTAAYYRLKEKEV